MGIITEAITINELKEMAVSGFGNLVKAVVDIDREIFAVDAELHSDLEALLLENGSRQKSLWGINLYPEVHGEGFIEFDSIVNMRPSQDNRSRGVESSETRKKIIDIVIKRVRR
ncbi:MAG: hypothetical protein HY589_03360 [Candidatus Omnitrophica bacterium]|nr:hypothetical protein [Candidatus Omnitrophota bacterium]